MNAFKPQCIADLKKKPLQQIWRDHLLAGSIIHHKSKAIPNGLFVVLYPQDNDCCGSAIARYEQCLSGPPVTFDSKTLEFVAETIKNETNDQWINDFIGRYLAFKELETTIPLGSTK